MLEPRSCQPSRRMGERPGEAGCAPGPWPLSAAPRRAGLPRAGPLAAPMRRRPRTSLRSVGWSVRDSGFLSEQEQTSVSLTCETTGRVGITGRAEKTMQNRVSRGLAFSVPRPRCPAPRQGPCQACTAGCREAPRCWLLASDSPALTSCGPGQATLTLSSPSSHKPTALRGGSRTGWPSTVLRKIQEGWGEVWRAPSGKGSQARPLLWKMSQPLESVVFLFTLFTGSPVVLWEVLSAWPHMLCDREAGGERAGAPSSEPKGGCGRLHQAVRTIRES